MKNFLISAAILISIGLLASCNNSKNDEKPLKPSHVEVKAVDGKYDFYVNGEIFKVKGAGGGNNLAALHDAGGNSVRTWGPNKGLELLDSAQKYHVMVAMA